MVSSAGYLIIESAMYEFRSAVASCLSNNLISNLRLRLNPARKSALNMLAANALIQVLNLGTGVVTARLLGPQGRGELAATIMWPQFLAYCLCLGLPAALVYHLKKHPASQSELVGASLVGSILAGSFAGCVGAIALPRWLNHYSSDVVHFAQFALLTAPLSLFGLLLTTALQGFESFSMFNWARVLQPLAILVAFAGIWVFGIFGPKTAALAYLIAPIPILVWNTAYLKRLARPSLFNLLPNLRRLYSYGLRYCFGELSGTISAWADRAVIAGILSPADLGLYVVVQSAAQVLLIVGTTIATLLFPKAAGMNPQMAIKFTVRNTIRGTVIAICIAIPAIMLGPRLLGLVYGPSFRSGSLIFAVLIGASLCSVVFTILLQGLLAVGRPGLASLTQIIGTSASFLFLITATPRFGLLGAATANLIAAFLRALFCGGALFHLAYQKSKRSTSSSATTFLEDR